MPTFKQNNVCIERCSNGTFPNIDTRTCDSCASRCQSCLNKDYCLECVSGSVAVEGRCVVQARCTAPKVSDSGDCVDACQVGMSAIDGRCVRRCPQGAFFWSGFCYNTCPVEAPLFTDNACVIDCPQGAVNIDGVCATLAIWRTYMIFLLFYFQSFLYRFMLLWWFFYIETN